MHPIDGDRVDPVVALQGIAYLLKRRGAPRVAPATPAWCRAWPNWELTIAMKKCNEKIRGTAAVQPASRKLLQLSRLDIIHFEMS